MKEKSEFIVVRDRESLLALGMPMKATYAPDLTFLYSLKDEYDISDEKTIALNLRNWHPWNVQYNSLIYKSFKRIDSYIPLRDRRIFSRWSPKETTRWLKEYSKKKGFNIQPIPLYFFNRALNDYIFLSKYFDTVNVTNLEESIYEIAKARFLIGMRLHSLIAATQLGKPFVALGYQPKVRKYCEDIFF